MLRAVVSKPWRPSCPAYVKLLDVMEHASDGLNLSWECVREETVRSILDKWYLSGHAPTAPVSLPFLPDLHSKIEKAWKNLYSACILQHRHANYADVEGICEHGYVCELSRRWWDINP